MHNVQKVIMSLLKSNAMGLQDDYPSWDFNDQKIHCSKPMVIDSNDSHTHQIFFDDNVTE